MSRSALSLFVFSIYLYIMGFVLVVAPDTLVRIFKFPDADGLWIRVTGMLVIILGVYYSHVARAEIRPFFAWTVIARTAVLLFFIAFVIAGLAPPRSSSLASLISPPRCGPFSRSAPIRQRLTPADEISVVSPAVTSEVYRPSNDVSWNTRRKVHG